MSSLSTPQAVIDRLLTNYTVSETGCWISNYSTGSHGYSQIGWQGGGRRAMRLGHRLSYEAHFGPIPDGLTVDHLCRVRKCINPDHLRLLTNSQNASDNGFATRTHCPSGHECTEANTRLNRKGHRKCITCAVIHNRVGWRRRNHTL